MFTHGEKKLIWADSSSSLEKARQVLWILRHTCTCTQVHTHKKHQSCAHSYEHRHKHIISAPQWRPGAVEDIWGESCVNREYWLTHLERNGGELREKEGSRAKLRGWNKDCEQQKRFVVMWICHTRVTIAEIQQLYTHKNIYTPQVKNIRKKEWLLNSFILVLLQGCELCQATMLLIGSLERK